MAANPFIFVEAVSFSKEDLLDNNAKEKDYVPFIVNKSLSYHLDALQYANDMNQYYQVVDNKLAFDYYLYALKPRKRFAKWVKKTKTNNTLIIQQYYSCSVKEALEIEELLTEEQINEIREHVSIGGRT